MYLIVGAGFLGAYLIRYLSTRAGVPILAAVRDPSAALPVPGVTYVPCDVTRASDLQALGRACAGERLTVFYFAACHNVDYLFGHPEEGKRVNLDALKAFLDTVPGIEKFLFASTDCVYGENPPGIPKLRETDPCAPVNEYGRQKLAAEKVVLARGYTAVRFSYMLGPSLLQKKHFYDTIYEKLSRGEQVDMIDGMVRSALAYETAARLLAKLSAAEPQALKGVFNLCSDGAYSKYALGKRIALAAGAPEELVRPITEAQAASFFKDRRASRSVMDNAKLKTLLGIREIPLEV